MSRELASPTVRFRIQPGDIPPEKAARRLHLTLPAFERVKENLYRRGFPAPDVDTGMYCLAAIKRWQKLRPGVRHLFPELTPPLSINQAGPPANMGERFRETQERKRDG